MTPKLEQGGSSDTGGASDEVGDTSSDKSKVTVVHNADNPARSDEAVILTDLEHDGDEEYHRPRTQEAQLQANIPPEEGSEEGDIHWPDDGGSNDFGATTEGVVDDSSQNWWVGGGPVATVKLVLENDLGVITRAWPLHQPLKALKAELSHLTQVPVQLVQLSLRGRVLSDGSTLRGAGVEANETVQVGVSSKRPHSNPLTLLAPTTPPIPTPDVITVIVVDADGGEREVVVEVEWNGRAKPWLGGFKHKISGLHYHNASTQTYAPSRTRPAQVTRSTQTVKTRPCGTQTNRQASTQTTHLHPLLLTPDAVLITPKPYSSEIRYDIRMVVMLQSAIRSWLARRKVLSLRKEQALLTRVSSEDPGATVKSSHSLSSSSGQSPQPNTGQQHKPWREAVPMTELYYRLESWRKRQVSQINSTMTGKARRRALVTLLDKETELLRSLEAHRALRSARRRNAAITRFLQEVSRAQVWEVGGESGGEVEVETPETQPVRNLAALATALQQDASTQTRLQQLNALATTVEHFHPTRGDVARTQRTGQELVSLARRGTHLLARGTTDARLRGLRKRLHTLIISYLHQVQGRESTVVGPRTIRAAGGKPVLVYGRPS